MAEDIDRRTVKRVIGMRKKGMAWKEICDQLEEPLSFQLRIRPLMKEVDPDSVLPLGPGSPTYGKRKAKASK
jgi:hypothetical protein